MIRLKVVKEGLEIVQWMDIQYRFDGEKNSCSFKIGSCFVKGVKTTWGVFEIITDGMEEEGQKYNLLTLLFGYSMK